MMRRHGIRTELSVILFHLSVVFCQAFIQAPALAESLSSGLANSVTGTGAGTGSSINAPDSEIKAPLRPEIKQAAATFTLLQAVETARVKYPSLQRRTYDTLKARAEINVARTEYLPRMDLIVQELRATQNVTAGTILPQFLNVIPIQSGAPARNSSFASQFGSNAGLNFSWELIDFGRRAANVALAKSNVTQTTAQQKLTELDVSFKAAASYLRTLSAKQQITARKATLERMQQWALVVHTLCDKGLKPGVDAFRADAEVSMAKIALIDANKIYDLEQQDLAEAMGMAGTAVDTVSGPFTVKRKEVPAFRADLAALALHPAAIVRSTDIDVSRAKLHLLDRTWYPHLWLESGIWGRGSGTNTFVKPVAAGVVPKTANWAVGFTLQFPIMQYFKVRADKQLERSLIDAKRAEYDLAMQQLIREDARAQIILGRAQEVSRETPVLVAAARENEIKAKERYRVGLTNVMEVAEAEQILARAETEDSVAQINVWLAQLTTAYAHGNLDPFLKLVALAEGAN